MTMSHGMSSGAVQQSCTDVALHLVWGSRGRKGGHIPPVHKMFKKENKSLSRQRRKLERFLQFIFLKL